MSCLQFRDMSLRHFKMSLRRISYISFQEFWRHFKIRHGQLSDLVNGFYASTCSGDSVYEIFENYDDIIPEYSTVWVKLIEKFGREGLLKLLTLTCHRIPIIETDRNSYKIWRKGYGWKLL